MHFTNDIDFKYHCKSNHMYFARTVIDDITITVRFMKVNDFWVISYNKENGPDNIYAIFNAVACIIRDFITMVDPDKLLIKAKKDSRIRLYMRLLQRLERFGYKYSYRRFGRMTFFRFER